MNATSKTTGTVTVKAGFLTAVHHGITRETIRYQLKRDGSMYAKPAKGRDSIRMRDVAERGWRLWIEAGMPEAFEATF
jgi:hypothetical protein